VLDIEDIQQEIVLAKQYHQSTLDQLDLIESNHLSGQVQSLQHSITYNILRPIERAEILIEIITTTGAENIPGFLLEEWYLELRRIQTLLEGYEHD
jgi:hypothetical protein